MTTENAQAKPDPEHKKLGVFLGRWHTTGDVAATDVDLSWASFAAP